MFDGSWDKTDWITWAILMAIAEGLCVAVIAAISFL